MKDRVAGFKEQIETLYPDISALPSFFKACCRYAFLNPGIEALNVLAIIHMCPEATKVMHSEAWNKEFEETVFIKKNESGIPQCITYTTFSEGNTEVVETETIEYQFDISQMNLKDSSSFNSPLWIYLNEHPSVLEELGLDAMSIKPYLQRKSQNVKAYVKLEPMAQEYVVQGVLSALSGIFNLEVKMQPYLGEDEPKSILNAALEMLKQCLNWIQDDLDVLRKKREVEAHLEIVMSNSKRKLDDRVNDAKQTYLENKERLELQAQEENNVQGT